MAAKNSETIVRELLELAEVEINGKNPWDIQVHNPNLYSRVLNEASLGLGEAYMDGWWDCEAIDVLVYRILKAGLDSKVKGNLKLAWLLARSRLFNLQTRSRALNVGKEVYDLGNDLYCAFLDKRLNYTCGYWKNATTLDEAQEAKLDLVCKKIGLQPGMRVLDVGAGECRYAALFGHCKYVAHDFCGYAGTAAGVLRDDWRYGRIELVSDIATLPIPDVSFDAVLCTEVLEHVPEPVRALGEMSRVLRVGGRLFQETFVDRAELLEEFTNLKLRFGRR